MKVLVAIGSYERIVFGCDVDIEKDKEGNFHVKQVKDSFAVPAHIASVRAVAACKKFLVSGSTDETIKYCNQMETSAHYLI